MAYFRPAASRLSCRQPAHQRAPESDLGAVTKRLRGRDHFSTRAGPVAIDAGQRAQRQAASSEPTQRELKLFRDHGHDLPAVRPLK